ncbi:MAG: MMPL family transporter [Pseudomonadota bacterium]|nr:MMPL family transporter [Pseudomonadota bacterium]
MYKALKQGYFNCVLDNARLTLGFCITIVFIFAWFIPQFELDASSDSLLLEDDLDLQYYVETIDRFGSDDFLVITYTARKDLFKTSALNDLKQLRDELLLLPNVDQVISIFDVPLIDSPRINLAQLQDHIPTLSDQNIDIELAKLELLESPIYKNLLMSLDGDTTAILLKLKRNQEILDLEDQRNEIRKKNLNDDQTDIEKNLEQEYTKKIKVLRAQLLDRQQKDITSIRSILLSYEGEAEIHLGGVAMIVSDMIEYIRNDIAVFGSAILIFLILMLSIIFRRIRWVVIPLTCCAVSVLLMAGLLGHLQWRVTVVSSNFVALLLIFSLSITVHLIQRYRELHLENKDQSQRWLVMHTMRYKSLPCIFTAITTMVGFASLLVSGIRPVIDFGWMMVIGMFVVLVTAFIVFPAMLMLLSAGEPQQEDDATQSITGFFATFVQKHSFVIAISGVLLTVISMIGVTRLKVENRFIDYFKENTEIYQGMLKIDQELGGTMPLDIVLDADRKFISQQSFTINQDDSFAEDDFDDEFNDDFGEELNNEFILAEGSFNDLGATSYWYNNFRLDKVREVHDYLDQLPETGKVLSMATTMEALEILNQDKTPGTFFLSVLYNRLPLDIKQALFDPYLSADGNKVRFSTRILETNKELRREELLGKIRNHLTNEMGFEPDRVHLTGMMLLYNNVLQSLYRSQILTMGVVFTAIMIMFAVLFRSIRIAFSAVLPSVFSVGMILGGMGLVGIPLDIMTITIAAICIGIGVDNSIHYVHRYRQELSKESNHIKAMKNSHSSTGRAMFYTSLITFIGFSILALSNFIPSILFGLLTGLAMLIALIANLTFLPLLLKLAKVS